MGSGERDGQREGIDQYLYLDIQSHSRRKLPCALPLAKLKSQAVFSPLRGAQGMKNQFDVGLT